MAAVAMVILIRQGEQCRRLRNMAIAMVVVIMAMMIHGMIVSAVFISSIILMNAKVKEIAETT